MGYWFKISFSPVDLLKQSHTNLLEEIAEIYSSMAAEERVFLVRTEDHSSYYIYSEQSLPNCFKMLMVHEARQCSEPSLPLEFVFGDRSEFNEKLNGWEGDLFQDALGVA